LTAPVVLPGGTPDLAAPEPVGPAQPVAPEPVTDGGGDRLVVATRPPVPDRPSATLLAAQQLSDEADTHPHRVRRPGSPAADRRRRRQRAVIAERRAGRGIGG
jgi:hypothetical protein